MKPIIIKVTDTEDSILWINASKIIGMIEYRNEGHTEIMLFSDGVFNVKETPEQIIELIKNG